MYTPTIEISESLRMYYESRKRFTKRSSITNQEIVVGVCAEMHELTRERFVALLLDSRNGLISKFVVDGQPDNCTVPIRDIVHEVIKVDAVGVIIVHNHPGGSSEWSASDLALTKRIWCGLKSIGCELIDHVLMYGFGDVSMRSQNSVWESIKIKEML